mgnify:CR=1 FL=1
MKTLLMVAVHKPYRMPEDPAYLPLFVGAAGKELNAGVYEYYKGLIAFRKAHPALRMTEQSEILASMEALQTGSNDLIAILNNGGKVENAKILTIINKVCGVVIIFYGCKLLWSFVQLMGWL